MNLLQMRVYETKLKNKFLLNKIYFTDLLRTCRFLKIVFLFKFYLPLAIIGKHRGIENTFFYNDICQSKISMAIGLLIPLTFAQHHLF